MLALIRNQMGSKCNPKKPLARVQTPNTPIQYQPPFLVVPFSRLHPSSEEKSPETKVGPRPRAKNIKPNVSAYNNGVPPPTLWRQGPRCRCTGPKINRGQKQVIWLSLGPAQIHAGPKKNPHRVQKTHRQVPQFFVPPGPTKNPARSIKHGSKKRVPRSRKTCIPKINFKKTIINPQIFMAFEKPTGPQLFAPLRPRRPGTATAGPASCPPWHRAGRSSAAPKARPDPAAPEIRGDFECETYRMGPPFEIAFRNASNFSGWILWFMVDITN